MEPSSYRFNVALGIVVAVLIVLLTAAVYWYTKTDERALPAVSQATTTPTPTTESTESTSTPPAPVFGEEAELILSTLDLKPWKWMVTTHMDGNTTTPTKAGAFVLTFNSSGGFSATTDCNQLTGSYEARNGNLSLGSIAGTKMFCEGSQEQLFTDFLHAVVSYQFTSDKRLLLKTTDGAEAVFQ